MIHISKETLQRLPGYLRCLGEIEKENIEYVSATKLADMLELHPVQVRKDLSAISSKSGKPKVGFKVDDIIFDIEAFLGYHDISKAIIIGVGSLGKALIKYKNFKNYGLKIVAGFDANKDMIGKDVAGTNIYNIDRIRSYVIENHIPIGIITVPQEYAQKMCDELVASGIKGIWNFAPVHLNVPDNVAVKYEDMAASLAFLSKEILIKLSETDLTAANK